MPTPNAARHRDLEQRLRHIENQLRQLTSAALYRRQLGVDQGDFVVQGGGSVVVKDGGGLQARYPNGSTAAFFGPHDTFGGNAAQGIAVRASDNVWVWGGYHDQVNGERVVMAGGATDPLKLYQVMAESCLAYGASGNAYTWITPDGDIQMSVASGRNYFLVNHPTTANGANCFISEAGGIYRSTSSLRYKTDVRIPHIDVQTVLAMQPRAFRDKGEVEREGDDARTHVGFIAEEAAELGLEPWVTRDSEGRPDAFNYAQWGVAQQAVLQEHQARIDDLEQRLSDQADTIAALEARLAAAGL